MRYRAALRPETISLSNLYRVAGSREPPDAERRAAPRSEFGGCAAADDHPIQVRYRAALRPETIPSSNLYRVAGSREPPDAKRRAAPRSEFGGCAAADDHPIQSLSRAQRGMRYRAALRPVLLWSTVNRRTSSDAQRSPVLSQEDRLSRSPSTLQPLIAPQDTRVSALPQRRVVTSRTSCTLHDQSRDACPHEPSRR